MIKDGSVKETSRIVSRSSRESVLDTRNITGVPEHSSRKGLPPLNGLVCYHVSNTIGGDLPQWSDMALSLGSDYQRYARLHTQYCPYLEAYLLAVI